MKNLNITSGKILLLLFVLKSLFLFAQNDKFNLTFEEFENNKITHWKIDTLLTSTKDSIIKNEGQYALRLENKSSSQNKTLKTSNIIPYTYNGKKIKFEGYIKTENITKGSVYLYVIIGNKTQQFDYRMTPEYKGTKNWQKFELEMPYTKEASYISLNCNFQGTGRIWLDDSKVLIDDKDINQLSPIKVVKKLINSNFSINKGLNAEEIEKLVVIGKVWGFLKYYHPAVISGKYDWDKELFKILSIYQSKNFKSELEKWVTSLGSFQQNKLHYPKSKSKQTADFHWFKNSLITKGLRKELTKISKAKRDSIHSYYVEMNDKVPTFKNELLYSNMNYKDDGIKLLALFRYWNIVEYFFPFKYLISENWDKVLVQEIPKLHKAQNKLNYVLALQELVARTEDTHSTILLSNPVLIHFFGEKKPPITVKNIDNKIVINGIYSTNTGLISGDEIIQVNHKAIQTLKDSIYKYSIGSNQAASDRNFARNCIRTNKDKIVLKIKRDSSYIVITVSTKSIFDIPKYRLPKHEIKDISKDIGYFHIESINKKQIDSIFNKWHSKKGIIIDFRGYPNNGFRVLMQIASYLFDKDQVMDSESYTDLSYPGVFSNGKQILNIINKPEYKGKVIILVDENSQSATEYMPMFLSYLDNVVIIGSQTAGTNAQATQMILPGNIDVYMSAIGMYTKDGKQVQKIGITPDIYVKENIKSIKANKDLVLEKAIKYISEK